MFVGRRSAGEVETTDCVIDDRNGQKPDESKPTSTAPEPESMAEGLKVWVPVRDTAGWAIAEVKERRDSEMVLIRRWPEGEGENEEIVLSKDSFEGLVPAPGGPPGHFLAA